MNGNNPTPELAHQPSDPVAWARAAERLILDGLTLRDAASALRVNACFLDAALARHSPGDQPRET